MPEVAATDRCLEHLRTIQLLWASLLSVRQPGIMQRTSNAPPGIEQARALRAERVEMGSAGGDIHAVIAPCDLTVVMAIDAVELALAVAFDQLLAEQRLPRRCSRCRHELEHHVRQVGCGQCERCDGFRLRRVAADDSSWEHLLVSERGATRVEHRLQTARRRVEETLDLVETGYLIMVPCPWCQGITEAMPTGSLTLRAFTPGEAPKTYVICSNPSCDPPSNACGYRFEGHPFWPYEELDWLSRQLDVVVDSQIERRRLLRDEKRAEHGAATGHH